LAGSKKMSLMAWKPNNKEDLDFIKELIESSKLVPVIDRRYPLNEVVDACRYFEEGHPQGKIVITVGHNCRTCRSNLGSRRVCQVAVAALTKVFFIIKCRNFLKYPVLLFGT
jgi:hypothetical protein